MDLLFAIPHFLWAGTCSVLQTLVYIECLSICYWSCEDQHSTWLMVCGTVLSVLYRTVIFTNYCTVCGFISGQCPVRRCVQILEDNNRKKHSAILHLADKWQVIYHNWCLHWPLCSNWLITPLFISNHLKKYIMWCINTSEYRCQILKEIKSFVSCEATSSLRRALF